MLRTTAVRIQLGLDDGEVATRLAEVSNEARAMLTGPPLDELIARVGRPQQRLVE